MSFTNPSPPVQKATTISLLDDLGDLYIAPPAPVQPANDFDVEKQQRFLCFSHSIDFCFSSGPHSSIHQQHQRIIQRPVFSQVHLQFFLLYLRHLFLFHHRSSRQSLRLFSIHQFLRSLHQRFPIRCSISISSVQRQQQK